MRSVPSSTLGWCKVACPAAILLLLSMAASFCPAQSTAQNEMAAARSGSKQAFAVSDDVIPGIVVIKFKRPGSSSGGQAVQSAAPIVSTLSGYGVQSLSCAYPAALPLSDADVTAGKVDLSQIHHAAIPSNVDPIEVAAQLAALPEVEYAEPKYRFHLCAIPNDSDFASAQQVYFDRMQVPSGWQLQRGSAAVVIATVDGGTNWQHPDLAQNIWVNPVEDINHDGLFTGSDINGIDDDRNGFIDDVIGWNFGKKTNDPRGFLPINANHGTETASAFGAVTNNGYGMAGTSWNCRVMPVCVSHEVSDDNVPYGMEGIQYAVATGARVINCSWGRAGGPWNYSRAEQDVITAATEAGALIVAAAGNQRVNTDERPFYPACYDHVLSVGATEDTSDRKAYFTDYGLNVSVYAPGMGIHAAEDDGSYGTVKGTSHSSPLVAGLAGLLFAAHPDWTPDQVAEQIRMTADPIDACNPSFAGSLGHGRVNFSRALSEAHSGVRVTTGNFRSTSRRPFFQEGDTVVLAVKVKNVLTIAAEKLMFTASSDPALEMLGPIPGTTRLDADAEDSLSWYFRVGNVTENREVKVRLSWTANTDEQDAYMFTTTVYAGTGYWGRQYSPTASKLRSVHAVSDRVAWAAGYSGYNWWGSPTVLKTADGGANWATVSGGLPRIPMVCVFAADSLHAWVGGGEGKIFATLDGGMSWTRQDYPLPRSGLIKGFWFFDVMNGYAWGEPDTYVWGNPGKPGRSVLLRTSDGGATWTHVANEPMSVTGTLGFNAFCCTDRQHLWFGAPNSVVWRSTDGGDSWSSVAVGTGEVTALAMRDDSVGIICLSRGANSEPPSIARTTDGGATWQQLPGVKPDGGNAAAFPIGSTEAWVAGGKTVICSRDGGMNWMLQPAQQFSCNASAISFCDPANGWIVTEGGDILRYHSLKRTTAVRSGPEVRLPTEALLRQNYPNPFNSKTGVRFEVPDVSDAKITVYDLLGREVAVLVNERKLPGRYEVSFDGSGLASGVYIYRLTTGSYAETRRMLLVK